MKMETGIVIDRVDNNIVWLRYYHEGKLIYETRFATVVREFLEEFYDEIDLGDPMCTNRGEYALQKLKIYKSTESEIKIA